MSRPKSDEPGGRAGEVLGYAGILGLILIGVLAKTAGSMSIIESILLFAGYLLVLALIGGVIAVLNRH